MNNAEYWTERTVKDAIKNWQTTAKAEKELDKLYTRILENINKEIAAFYANYATDNLFTYQAVNELLTRNEQLLQAQSIADLVNVLTATSDNPFLTAELAKIEASPSITRLDELMKRIAIESVRLAELQESIVQDNLSKVYEETYYKNLYNLAIGTGQISLFTVLPTDAILTAISIPIHGTYFSQSIWDNREVLAKKIRIALTDGLTQGFSYKKMSKVLADEMNASYKMALRVIRTETSKVMSEGGRISYENFGVEKYQIIATLDSKTSEICQKQDLKIYSLSEFEIGKTASPFHPNCRSTQAPYIENMDGTRLAKDENGKVYEVPANMKYEEWFNKFVKK